MIMVDVYFYEAFEEEVKALKSELNADVKAEFSWKTIQEKADPGPPSRLISIRTQSVIPITWAGQIKAVLTRSTGFEHLLDYEQKAKSSVNYGYLPLYCNRAVAEQACLLWMSLLRKLKLQLEQFKSFERDGLTGQECEKKTLLVVGVGNIGSEVVRIGEGLGMQVVGVDIVERFPTVNYVTIDEAISRADIIVCSMNLTPENKGYFNYSLLRKAKKGVIFVNIARGEMSPSTDLLRLIEEDHLGGLGMDVFNKEAELATLMRQGKKSEDQEIKATSILATKPNVLFTPHNAFNTLESVERKSQQSIQQIENYLKTGQFIWPV
ncbi:MAG: hydroxyacid dehydrogenase, partial [bacterium]